MGRLRTPERTDGRCPLLRPLRLGSPDLRTPLLLAPMAGQTDHAFRQVCREQGGLGLATSELVSARALKFPSSRSRPWNSSTGGLRRVRWRCRFAVPNPEMADAAREVVQAGAAVVDVNMGCWVPAARLVKGRSRSAA